MWHSSVSLLPCIQAGADVNTICDEGNTVLLCAALAGHDECVKVSLEAGADVNIINSKGESALLATLYDLFYHRQWLLGDYRVMLRESILTQ